MVLPPSIFEGVLGKKGTTPTKTKIVSQKHNKHHCTKQLFPKQTLYFQKKKDKESIATDLDT